ncbi:DoxX family protein [Paenibacillus sp. HJGM_3]|uniref:DoxX family protein n=1 Tax=Paenibacillus sp. HJGM_3 TaxID=3379816 RepID=UPI00385B7E3B
MSVFILVLQSLLVLYFGFSGVAKVIGAQYWVDMFTHLRLPQWFRVVTGIVQLIGAGALIVGYWMPGAIAGAGVWLGITMLIACLTHVQVKDSIGKTMPALVFAGLNVTLVILNAGM